MNSINWNLCKIVAKRDLREITTDMRLVIVMVALATIVPFGTAFAVLALHYYEGEVTTVVQKIASVGAFFVVFFPASFSLVMSMESFVGERERSTLEVLFSTPLTESEIYIGKLLSVFVVALGLSYVGLLFYCTVIYVGTGYLPFSVLLPLIPSIFAQIAVMIFGSSIMSSHARTLRSANAMASLILIPMSIVLQGQMGLIIVGREELLWPTTALMAIISVLLFRMGSLGFSREGMLARDAGEHKFAKRTKFLFTHGRLNLPYLHQVLPQRWGAVFISALCWPLGASLGYLAGFAKIHPSPTLQHFIQVSLNDLANQHQGLPLTFFVFSHGLSAILITGLLAPLTAGLSSVALSFVPAFIIGYLAEGSSWGAVFAAIFPQSLLAIPIAILAGGFGIHLAAVALHMEREGSWSQRMRRGVFEYLWLVMQLTPFLLLGSILQAYFRS